MTLTTCEIVCVWLLQLFASPYPLTMIVANVLILFDLSLIAVTVGISLINITCIDCYVVYIEKMREFPVIAWYRDSAFEAFIKMNTLYCICKDLCNAWLRTSESVFSLVNPHFYPLTMIIIKLWFINSIVNSDYCSCVWRSLINHLYIDWYVVFIEKMSFSCYCFIQRNGLPMHVRIWARPTSQHTILTVHVSSKKKKLVWRIHSQKRLLNPQFINISDKLVYIFILVSCTKSVEQPAFLNKHLSQPLKEHT